MGDLGVAFELQERLLCTHEVNTIHVASSSCSLCVCTRLLAKFESITTFSVLNKTLLDLNKKNHRHGDWRQVLLRMETERKCQSPVIQQSYHWRMV